MKEGIINALSTQLLKHVQKLKKIVKISQIAQNVLPIHLKIVPIKFAYLKIIHAKKYINERFLPDKAIDLIDEAGAYRKLHPVETGQNGGAAFILVYLFSAISPIHRQFLSYFDNQYIICVFYLHISLIFNKIIY